MAENSENKETGLLAKEKIEDNEGQKLDTQKLEEINDGDDFKGYKTIDKYKLFGLFFLIGIINHLGTILVMTGGRLLANELGMGDYLTFYSSASILFAFITRIVNSKLFIRVSYSKRIFFLCFWNIAGYFSMFLILLLHDTALSDYSNLCFILSFIPCFFLGSAYAFGESSMIAYLRLFPKTLLGGWSSGTGLSGIIGGLLNFLSQLNTSFSIKYLYLILTPVGGIYFYLFKLTFTILVSQERNMVNGKKNPTLELSPIDGDTVEPENDEDLGQGAAQINNQNNVKEEEKEMEDINKGNKSMSIENFIKVMKSCGEVIGNLGIIYFFQFFCMNAILVRVCDKVTIGFLHEKDVTPECSGKGKFEFILLFYQLGMFISKSLIKIVRMIRPIEVYTVVTFIINILFIIEYYAGFLGWGNYIWISIIMGFFGGGTYSGGFYTILNSDKVQDNYKELTVNVATLFNDTGTFLSGIFGFLGLKYWFSSNDCF